MGWKWFGENFNLEDVLDLLDERLLVGSGLGGGGRRVGGGGTRSGDGRTDGLARGRGSSRDGSVGSGVLVSNGSDTGVGDTGSSVRVNSGVSLVEGLGVVDGLDALLAVVVVLVGVRVDTSGSGSLGLTLVEGVLVGRGTVGLGSGSSVSPAELVKGDSGEDSRLVNDGGLVDLLVDGDDGVDGLVSVGLFLDDGLDVLVNVVVSVLVDRGTKVGGGSLGLSNDGGVGVLSVLSLEPSLVLGGELVSLLSGDLGDNVGLVLGSKGLGGGNGLDSVLVVVDVPLPVDSLGGLDVLVLGDVLLGDGGGSLGADLGGSLLSRGVKEVLDLFHVV